MDYIYASVIISISHNNVDKEFSYIIPPNIKEKITIGHRVLVPFGENNKQYEGYIIGFSNEIDFPKNKAKFIICILDEEPILSNELLELAFWMKTKYYTTFINCIKCIVPTGIGVKSDFLVEVIQQNEISSLTKKQLDIIDYIINNDNKILLNDLEIEFGKSLNATVNWLNKNKYIKLISISQIKNLSLFVTYLSLNYDNEEIEYFIEQAELTNSKQNTLIKLLSNNDEFLLSDLKTYFNVSDYTIKTLIKKNIVLKIKKEVKRNVIFQNKIHETPLPILVEEQQKAINNINLFSYKKPILLHGVTGSGKTEVYMRLIQDTINENKQAIVLVPEIALTDQFINVFYKRFGSIISVTHSRLSVSERYDQWRKAFFGEISIMIGARSALFTPFKNLGLIIIDEEHENTYKSETTPKYSSVDVAIKRAELNKCKLILGSATPSIDSFFRAKTRLYEIVSINKRINNTLLNIDIIDMRLELQNGNKTIFSEKLITEIGKNVKKNQQTILFLNRRGHSVFVSCRKCGEVLKCNNCNVNYTYHIYTNKLMCHHCASSIQNPSNCLTCGSKFIKYFGIGTQKVEEDLKKVFPQIKVSRMDMDTTKGKYGHEKIINEFRSGKTEVLIGTQMITKGLDFPNVSLVGVIAADLSLNIGDYRSGEITYQLLTQVAGRAGRSELEGRVVIQTYTPEHYSVKFAKEEDYISFYEHEISLRRQMNYPPFSNLFNIMFVGEDEKKVIENIFKLLNIMSFYNKKGLFEMLGPAPATISKIKNKYRWKLTVKCEYEDKIRNFVLFCVNKLKEKENLSTIKINLSLNPSFL